MGRNRTRMPYKAFRGLSRLLRMWGVPTAIIEHSRRPSVEVV